MTLVRELQRARARLAQTKTEVEILTQNVKAIIADGAGVEWSDPAGRKGKGHITYKQSADGSTTDWQAAWRSLVTEAQLVMSLDAGIDLTDRVDMLDTALRLIADEDRSIALYTSPVSGSRRFVCPSHWSKNKEI
jgi:hypothetical protein